ncbi:MAG: O-antigen ligase family protein [Elusimicrobiota bacterium]
MKKNRFEKIDIIPLSVIIITLIFLPWFKDAFIGPKVLAGGVLGILLCMFWGVEKIKLSRFRIPIIVIVIYNAFALLVLGKFRFAGGNYPGLVLIGLIAGIISGIKTSKIKQKIHFSLVLSGLIVSIYSVLQYYGISGEFSRFSGTSIPYSTLGNRNYIADLLILILPFLILMVKKEKYKYISLPGLLVLGWTLVLTRSWRVLIGILSIAFIYYLICEKRKRKRYKYIFIGILSIIILLSFINSKSIYKSHIKPRLHMWSISWTMIKQKPVTGHGIGTYDYEYPEFQYNYFKTLNKNQYIEFADLGKSPQRANNEYIHLISEQGIIGLILVLWLLIKWFKNIDLKDDFTSASVCGVAGVLGTALIGFPLHRPSIILIICIIMGITLKPDINKKNAEFRYSSVNIILVLLGIFILICKTYSQISWYNSIKRFESKDYNSAEMSAKRAALCSFVPGEVYFLLGRIYFRQGNFEKSLQSYKISKKTYNNRSLYYNMGLVYIELNQINRAVKNLEKAVYTTPDFKPAYEMLIKILTYEKKYDMAEKYEDMLKKIK